MSMVNMILSLYIFVNILLVNIYGVRVKIQARSLPNRNDVALQCTDDNDFPLVTTNIGLYRTSIINDQSSTELFTDFIFDMNEARFNITPEIEGNFSCIDQDTNTTSSNTVVVIATPTIDPDYIIPSINYALIGSNVTLSCSYPIGILTQYYTVIWYIGSSVIDPNDPHYGILPNLSLSINNVLLNDNSDGYYCEVSVHEPNNDMIYSEYGYDTTLIVYDDLDLYSNTLDDTIVPEGISSIVFTCITHSIPPGTIRWLIHGTYITTNNTRYTTSKQVNMTSSIAIVTSQLVINNPIPSDSGVIQCIGYINNGIDIIFESSQATLTVIGNSFTPVIAVTNNGSLLLSITLPANITQLFNIHIRYNNNVTIHDQILTDSLFYNTAIIDRYMIDTATIPFNSFAVAIAIEINGIIGEYTTLSNTIVLPDSNDVTIVTTSMTSSSMLTTYSSVESPTITMSSNTATCDTCSCSSIIPFIIIITILIVLLLTSFVIMIVIGTHNRKRSSKRIDSHELQMTNPSVYTKDISTCTSQTTHEDDSHTLSVTGDSHTPSVTDDSHSYLADEHNHSYTPSRPSSQESFYPDKSRTVSPMPHIYENDCQNNTNIESNVIENVIEKENRTMSSIAVGTSPPRDGKEIIISFMKGQSESPKRTEDRRTGVLSPARSDPSLESSLKSDYSKKIFTESVPIPKGPDTRDQDTIMSPTEEEPLIQPVQSCTYQQKMYGSNKPPVLAEEPKKEDEKIYQKIIKEYDVV